MQSPEQKLTINYKGNNQELNYIFRPGFRGTILWLHAFSCSKDDFASAFSSDFLKDYALAGFNFPGSPGSSYPENLSYSFDDLMEMAKEFILKLDLKNVIAVGHSTGSLVAVLLAKKYPELVKAVVSVEGNMDLGDCWLTSRISDNSYEDFVQKILPDYLEGLKGGRIEIYAEHLKRVNPKSCFDYAPSVLRYSSTGLKDFLSLKIPKLFVYATENSSLSYLPTLKQASKTVEIPNSNHWPSVENPQAFYKALKSFVEEL